MELFTLIKNIIEGLWGYIKFLHLIEHWEEGVILRNGKYHRSRGPGLWWKIPMFEYGHNTNIKPDTFEVDSVNIVTKDGKTVIIGVIVEFKVFDVKLFFAEHNDSLSNMRDLTRGETSDLLEERDWEVIKSKTTKSTLKDRLSVHFTKMGVEILSLNFTDKFIGKGLKLHMDKQKTTNTLNV